MGAEVHEIAVYDTRLAEGDQRRLTDTLENERIDVVTFTSSSTVKNFRRLLPDNRFENIVRNLTIASIGPVTTRTAGKLGFTVHIQARRYTIDGLCDAIVEYYHDLQTHR
jgi:uroporphyrinogen III methyltransferase/synthase